MRYSIVLDGYSPDEAAAASLEPWESDAADLIQEATELTPATKFHRKALANCIAELGKLRKSSYSRMSYSDLVVAGLKEYASQPSKDAEDEYARNYYVNAARYALKHNNLPHIFYKDATASGLQVLGVVLGCKDDEVRRHLNLADDGYWYDTYTYIIDRFLSKVPVGEAIAHFFKRRHLKKTIMLINYKGCYVNCLKSFLQSTGLRSDDPHYEEAVGHFRLFYLHLTQIFDGEEFFKRPSSFLINVVNSGGDLIDEALKAEKAAEADASKVWIESIVKRLRDAPTLVVEADVIDRVHLNAISCKPGVAKSFELKLDDGFSVSFNYMEKQTRRVEINPREADLAAVRRARTQARRLFIVEPEYKAHRASVKLASVSGQLDFRAMERAFRANFTHSIDALIVRQLIAKVGGPVLTIHDCAGVRLLELRGLKSAACSAYSNIGFSCGGTAYKILSEVSGDFVLN